MRIHIEVGGVLNLIHFFVVDIQLTLLMIDSFAMNLTLIMIMKVMHI